MTWPGPPRRGGTTWVWVLAAVVVLVTAFGITAFVTPGFLRPAASVSGLGQLVRGAHGITPPATPPATSEGPPVSIPSARTPEPHRTQALADPSDCSYPPDPAAAAGKTATPPAAGPEPASGTVGVDLRTTAGDIGLTLDRALAPCTVASFVALAKQGFYTGTSCHRLGTTDLQMLQCGDPLGDGTGGPGYTVPDEFFPELTYGRGLVALANTGQPGSGGSQFFMMFGDTPIPPSYTVFGTISDAGLAVLDKIARGGVDTSGPGAYGDGTGPPNIPVDFTAVFVQS
ncbi:peptidylprolyl isomerase [Amycolatopsis sp. FDAARGOS 1241]|uniref:peptidylprolyl isomerase n=1 Tax=Amycolatopsis sp. FDAARGOS 1241 TaxID=2778070 RepID=UPI0019529518|nr:peptidylprolyl isomerase [Amycolatopsis sp. FDAARGOS 1241]QRP49001.1 peptidylprolyl isomerase [Amycolatopsis sp. FDAARGOS 1241]